MNMNCTRNVKRSRILLLAVIAVAVSLAAACSTAVSHADTYNLTVTYAPTENIMTDDTYQGDVPATMPVLPEPTTINVYRIGDHTWDSDGKATFDLADELDGITLPPNGSELSEWLSRAETIKGKIPEGDVFHKDGEAYGSIPSKNITATDLSVSFGLEPGLYLVTGSSQTVSDYPKTGDTTFWYPQPMLVQILQKDTQVNLKPLISYEAAELSVKKIWEDKEAPVNVRPESIKVIITYNGEEPKALVPAKEGGQTKSPIELSDEKGWSYSWKTTRDMNDPTKWDVEEVMDSSLSNNYTFLKERKSAGREVSFTITNTYDRKELELTKALPVYLQHSDQVSTVFVFQLQGYRDGEETPSYEKIVGIEFTEAGTKKTIVENIPNDLTSIIVKEISATNYNIDPESAEQEATWDKDDKIWKVSFKNDKDGTHTYEGGVINKFEMNRDEKGNPGITFKEAIGILTGGDDKN